MDYPILSTIKSPADVKTLNSAELKTLCDEIRNCIITTVAKNGGHLASNLGAVELTVALHRVFSSPEDAIIFDVGHQCYTHKLITGRFDRFNTLRTEGGISGFMKPIESEHDPFITGHSSNSISAAYGIYCAKKLKGEEGTAIAVIGDGAMTGGMAYEALNNAGNGKSKFLVILNDNEMSISKNVGSLAKSLTKMRNKPRYHRFKSWFSNFLLKIPFVGKSLNKFFYSVKEAAKGIVYKKNIFSALGFNYLGPVNGHDIQAMESLFKVAQSYNDPCLIHVITTKGKGYTHAERNPNNYHGVAPFDVEKGSGVSKGLDFSAIAGRTLCKLAENNSDICAITAAMTEGTGLGDFAENYKDRFFDVGIAEQHAVTFSAGLAKQGMKPFFAVYSSFLQRGYDQLIHDAATVNLPLKILVDRAGIVGEDGETHQGLFDVAYLKSIPNMNIYSPSNYKELEFRIEKTSKNSELCAIRYPRGCESECGDFDIAADYSLLDNGKDKLIVTYGRLYSEATQAVKNADNVSVLKLNKIYPLPEDIAQILSSYGEIYFFEETEKCGGIGETVAAELLSKGYKGKFKLFAVENKFVPAASTKAALKANGLDSEAILKEIV